MNLTATPVVAAFDLDGTLTEGGSVFKWLRYVCGDGPTFRAALVLSEPLALGALRSGPSADRAKERLFERLLRGRDLESLRGASREFAVAHLEARGRPRTLARLAWHLDQGHDVVVVSASPQLYVEVVAVRLGARGALGTRLAVDERGTLSGTYLGRNCRGSEKLRRFTEWVEAQNFSSEPTVYAYGNSRGDRRLLLAATFPYDVGRLGPVGALRRFPRLPR